MILHELGIPYKLELKTGQYKCIWDNLLGNEVQCQQVTTWLGRIKVLLYLLRIESLSSGKLQIQQFIRSTQNVARERIFLRSSPRALH